MVTPVDELQIPMTTDDTMRIRTNFHLRPEVEKSTLVETLARFLAYFKLTGNGETSSFTFQLVVSWYVAI